MSGPAAERRRVVVTGMGAITPLGCDVETFWAAATAGRSGVGPIDLFDVSAYPCRIAGQAWDFGIATEAKPGLRRGFLILAVGPGVRHVHRGPAITGDERPARVGIGVEGVSGGSRRPLENAPVGGHD